MDIGWIKEVSIHIDILTIGMSIMMMFYYMARSFQAHATGYKLYALYLLSMNIFIIAMYFYHTYHVHTDPPKNVRQFYRMLVVSSQVISYIFYFQFVRLFLNLRQTLPEIHAFFSIVQKILFLYLGVFFVFVYILSAPQAASISFDIVRILLIAVSLYSMIKAYRIKNKLTNYFILGNGLYLMLAILAWILNLIPEPKSVFFLFVKAIFGGMQPAVIVESLCFALGLSYKESLLEREKHLIQEQLIETLEISNQQQQVFAHQLKEQVKEQTEKVIQLQQEKFTHEKEQAIHSERGRIARDMHDDLGSGLSAIHLLSNFVKENASEKYPEFSEDVEKIRLSSEELNHRIREIIWTINTKDDNLTALVLFIRRYGHELQDKTKTNIHIHSEDPVPDIQLNGVQRKHIFLCVKEALNNALKHGKPTAINIYISSDEEKEIAIRVVDNGGGFSNRDQVFKSTGNGLRNMEERMNDIGGTVEIESGNQGTEVRLVFNV